ncbi:hypothetical protein [Mycobacterium sp. shizuoka-1]|uniref:hypothetical protein n=1 Tax=Mycobacterium sp. shizuoka-1 TaxID=2039281 RepID=UPI000C05EACA|nr:hypothetical protein [Mycobacterium sp. shizuoka-1]GAY15569.1 hypothetical protein MSZK_22950 [Mycobacterium sp. shizuoka-1]
MGRMSDAVMQHPLNLLWQNIFMWASWLIVLAMLAVAVLMGLRQRTPFYVLTILAAGVAAFAEPLYDVAFDLWFYDAHDDGTPGAAFSHFSAFGVVQPIWTHSGYVILYAAASLYAGRLIYEGRLTHRGLFFVWGAEIAMSTVFEVIGTGTDVYTYYGPYVGRIWNYPVVIGVLEGTQTLLFTVVAVLLWRKVSTNWGLLSLFVVFPITFFGANFGIGAPVIIALHLDGGLSTDGLVAASTILSIALCAVVVYGLSRFLPTSPADDAQASSRVDVSAREASPAVR